MVIATRSEDKVNTIQQTNRELAQKLNEDFLRNPQSRNTGKLIGIANGNVVVAADNWDDVVEQLDRAWPDAAKTLCFELGRDYKTPQEIWEAD